LLSAIRKLFFWNYARNTWQWDILCVLILIFIFLTPKSWFENSERRGPITHQNATARTLLLSPELIENAGDRGQVEQRVRAFMGRDDIRVLDVRKLVDEQGRVRGYEVDIH
jgi:hypothetical protein